MCHTSFQVNCETDFVARNDAFKSLVSMTTQATMEHGSPKLLTTTDHPSVNYLTTDSILSIDARSDGSVADLVAKTVGHLSENIVIQRGCVLSVAKGTICSLAYNSVSSPGEPVGMGTYAALVHLLPTDARTDLAPDLVRVLGNRLCQHVIGASPQAVYPGGSVDGSQALVEQNFVLDESRKVGDMLKESGVEVTTFIRYALGETEDQD